MPHGYVKPESIKCPRIDPDFARSIARKLVAGLGLCPQVEPGKEGMEDGSVISLKSFEEADSRLRSKAAVRGINLPPSLSIRVPHGYVKSASIPCPGIDPDVVEAIVREAAEECVGSACGIRYDRESDDICLYAKEGNK